MGGLCVVFHLPRINSWVGAVLWPPTDESVGWRGSRALPYATHGFSRGSAHLKQPMALAVGREIVDLSVGYKKSPTSNQLMGAIFLWSPWTRQVVERPIVALLPVLVLLTG
jgi:hypothetical protein